MDYIVICLVALLGSALTFFSGFGLGTLLVPVFAIFFPIELAIALTAIVHFLNSAFKLFLVGRHADKKVVLAFGIPSILAALLGAYLLTLLSGLPPLHSYFIFEKNFTITPIKLTVALLMIVFALFDLLPRLSHLHFNRKYLPVGGLLSGFFGGLSGNQGALRSAFLVKANLTKEAFIATGVVIALLIDVSRLTIYIPLIDENISVMNYTLVAAATFSAFIGAFLGNKFLKKITITIIQYIVGVMLIAFALLLGPGVL